MLVFGSNLDFTKQALIAMEKEKQAPNRSKVEKWNEKTRLYAPAAQWWRSKFSRGVGPFIQNFPGGVGRVGGNLAQNFWTKPSHPHLEMENSQMIQMKSDATENRLVTLLICACTSVRPVRHLHFSICPESKSNIGKIVSVQLSKLKQSTYKTQNISVKLDKCTHRVHINFRVNLNLQDV